MTKTPLGQEAKLEITMGYKASADKSIHLRTGLLREQRFVCANHSDEEIVLDQIGWQNFNCPKCGTDYSIGRKIAILEQVLSHARSQEVCC